MKVRKISIFNQLFILLAILLLAGNAILGVFVYNRSEASLFQQIQSNAKNIAQCAAMNVSGDVLRDIGEADAESEAYATVIDELALFRDNAEIEYIYTLRQVGESQFEFVVDADTEEPAAIGDECEATDAMNEAFSKQITTADNEPFTDEWGSHVSAYSPIFAGETLVGAVGVDISANWIDEQMQALRNLVIIVCVVTYAISLIILLLLMVRFKKGMGKLNDKVKELAGGSGDLTKEIDIDSGDELEVIAENMNLFIRQVRSLVKDVAASTENIRLTGEELNTTVSDNNQVMLCMNSEIEGISENMERSAVSSKILSERLAESAEEIATFAQNVNNIYKLIRQANENAQRTSAEAKENRENTLDSIQALQERMVKISKDAEKIEQVKVMAEEIGSIASQTRMLSLNAQIEAARAGSMGAGFAVVATEVGNLSNDIDKAVTEINNINSEVLAAVGALTETVEDMIRFVSGNVVKDYDSFAAMGEEYGNTTDEIRIQMMAIENQSTQISNNIADINASVQGIASTVASTAESANDLALSTRQISESFEDLNVTSQKNSLNSESLSEQVKKYTF